MEPTRQIYWNTHGRELMYVLALVAFTFFCAGFYKNAAGWRKGRKGQGLTDLGLRVKSLFFYVIRHDKKVFMSRYRRRMHLAIFFGFSVMLFGTTVIALQEDFNILLFYGTFYLILSLALDLAGLAALIGIGMAAYKRFQKKPDREITVDDVVLLGLVAAIILTGFILEGLRIYATGDPWAVWTPVGQLISLLLQISGVSIAVARSVHAALWYVHMFLALGFIAYIPYSKLFHLFVAPLNIMLRPLGPKGALVPVEPTCLVGNDFGVTKLEDFSKKQLMELDACIACGRCQKHCPAYKSGEALSPQKVIWNLKRHLRQKTLWFGKANQDKLVDGVISQEALWSCTTCGLCEKKCPVHIEHINRIVDLRRGLGNYPKELEPVFANLAEVGNPWGMGAKDHVEPVSQAPLLVEKQQTDILYWVGCFGAYETRNQRVTQAMFNILQKGGVDYAVLGTAEKCCGESVRRLGNESLFQQLARENIKTLNRYRFNTIVTHCPHCLNTLKNEYPQFGGKYQVLHHSQLIANLIESGKIKPKMTKNRQVTFQDPCYLGRFNNISDAPRKVLQAVPGLELLEMKDNKSMSVCCGAGGGRIWLQDTQEQRINIMRAKEAVKLDPDILASACSACLISLSDAVKKLNADVKNMDIAEIIQEVL